jgi:hypothetical protein
MTNVGNIAKTVMKIAPDVIAALQTLAPLVTSGIGLVAKANAGQDWNEADLANAEKLRRAADALVDEALMPGSSG